VIVAVSVVLVVELAVDEIVGVVAVRNRRMPAGRGMNVAGDVPAAALAGVTGAWIVRVDGDRAFLTARRMKVTLVQIVDVTVVLDGGVAAAGSMDVIVVRMGMVAHLEGLAGSIGRPRGSAINSTRAGGDDLASREAMHRNALWMIWLAACGESHLPVKPLPELVMAQKAVAVTVKELLLVPNETMIWDVHAQGLTIGRAELVVGDTDVHSKFKTGTLASAFSSVHYELTTVLDRAAARPSSATETLEIDGDTKHYEASFDGASYTQGGKARSVPGGAHTMHSALGWLRAWAQPDAHASSVLVVEAGRLYKLEVAQPMLEDLEGTQTLHIDCRIQGGADPIAFTIWLGANRDRKPLRIVATVGTLRLIAELIETS
jgi:hypothetical protein